MNHHAHGYFGSLGIGNAVNLVLLNILVVSALQNLANNAQELHNAYDRVRSDMIAKKMDGLVKYTFLKKLSIYLGECEWADSGGIIRNNGTNMLHLLLKSTNPATPIFVSNLKYEIENQP